MVVTATFGVLAKVRPARVVDPRSPLAALVGPPAVGVAEGCSLAEVVELMQTASVSAVLVGERAGIVTERDLARALGAGHGATDTVDAVVTRHPIAVPERTSVVEAAALMLNERIRHLIVELDGGGVAVVSIRDLLAVLLQAIDPDPWLGLRIDIEAPSELWLG